ncbi:MAG: CvpA family protein [Geminicoccaceae bacterium]|nr:CvpA family protein [Geminicoccaceae bacterium]
MSGTGLTVLDIAVAVLVGLSALLAMSRGVVREGLGLLCWIGAFAVAWFGFAEARPYVAAQVHHPLLADIATGLAVFAVPLVVFKIVAQFVARGVEGGFLGPVDRLLGLLFGAARGAFIVVAGYLIASMIVPPKSHPDWVRNAATLPLIKEGAAEIASFLPPEIVRPTRGTIEAAGGAVGQAVDGYAPGATDAVDRLVERTR